MTFGRRWSGCAWWCTAMLAWWLCGTAAGQRIGVLKGGDFTAFDAAVAGFREGLEEEGKSYKLIEILLDPRNQQKSLSALQASGPQLIYAVGNQATLAALGRQWDIPVLFALVTAPWQFGILDGTQRQEARVSGVVADIPLETQLDVLRQILPSLQKIGLLYSVSTLEQAQQIQAVLASRNIGMEAQVVRQTDDVVGVAAGMAEMDLFWMLPDRSIFAAHNRKSLFAHLRGRRIPIFAPTAKFLQGEDGGDLAIAVDPRACGRQAAGMAVDALEGDSWPPAPQVPRTWNVFLKEGRPLRPMAGAVYVK